MGNDDPNGRANASPTGIRIMTSDSPPEASHHPSRHDSATDGVGSAPTSAVVPVGMTHHETEPPPNLQVTTFRIVRQPGGLHHDLRHFGQRRGSTCPACHEASR